MSSSVNTDVNYAALYVAIGGIGFLVVMWTGYCCAVSSDGWCNNGLCARACRRAARNTKRAATKAGNMSKPVIKASRYGAYMKNIAPSHFKASQWGDTEKKVRDLYGV